MEDNKSSPPDNLKEGLAEKALSTLSKKYIVIGKTHVRAWKAWLAMGLVAGLITGIAYVANRSGEFEKSGAVSQSQDEAEEPYEPGGVLVVFRKNVGKTEQEKAIKHWGFKNERLAETGPATFRLSVPENTEDAVIEAIRKNPNVEFAQKNYALQTTAAVIPNDYYYTNGYLWWVNKIGLPDAWGITQGSPDIAIANIDTGLTPHPDLAGKVEKEICMTRWCGGEPWYLYPKTDSYRTDDEINHGTPTAGVAAAIVNNEIGITGSGNKTKIFNVRTDTGSCGIGCAYAYYDDIYKGIIWSAQNGAEVISINYFNGACPPSGDNILQVGARYANSFNIPVFVGGGNGQKNRCPNIKELISIGITNSGDQSIDQATHDIHIDLVAPGVNIYYTNNTGGYEAYSGTSFSTPITAGVAALMRSINSSLSPSNIEAILKCTAVDLGAPGWDKYFGWGRIDAYKAVSVAAGLSPNCASKDTTPPQISSVEISPIDEYQTVSGVVEISAAVSDESGIKEVEFYIDPPMDAPEFLASTDSSEPFTYTWDTTTMLDGTVVIQVVVKDNEGNVNASSPRYVGVSNGITDTKAPAIRITSPAANSVITKSFTISAEAKDNVSVKKIDLFFDGGLMKTCTGTFTATTTCSISLSFRKLSSGTHTVRADAFDAIPNATSTQITVTSGSTTKGGGKGGRP